MAERKKIQPAAMKLNFEIEEKKEEKFEIGEYGELSWEELINGATPEDIQQIAFMLAASKAHRDTEEDYVYTSVDGDGINKPVLNFKIGHKKKELLNKSANSL